jgi:phosphomannomutase
MQQLAGVDVSFTDFSNGWGDFPATDAIQLDLADGRRVIVRPSGTEPKLKCYLQAVSDTDSTAQALLFELKQAMQSELV